MSEQPTPETDAVRFYLKTRKTFEMTDYEIWKNNAIKLERERDEVINRLREWSSWCVQYMTERNDLQKAVNGLCKHIGVNPANTTLLAVEVLRIERERDEARERCAKLEKAMSYGKGKHLLDRFLQVVKERDEAKEELSKLTGTHLSVALSERNDALNQMQGWENKWKAAVEMAAIAEIKCNDLKEEIANLQDQRDLAMKVIKRLEANQP